MNKSFLKLLACLVIVIEESGTDDAKLALGYAKEILNKSFVERDENGVSLQTKGK